METICKFRFRKFISEMAYSCFGCKISTDESINGHCTHEYFDGIWFFIIFLLKTQRWIFLFLYIHIHITNWSFPIALTQNLNTRWDCKQNIYWYWYWCMQQDRKLHDYAVVFRRKINYSLIHNWWNYNAL